jgi:hypothetical protein
MIMMRSMAEMMRDTGDYQFDIYRIMREHVGSDWEKFNPFTNVMVLSNLLHQPIMFSLLFSGCITWSSNSSSQKI